MTKEKTLADKIIFIDNLIDSTFSKKTYLYYRDIIKEIERLNNIINEAREYLENTPRIVKSIHYRDKESNYAFIENYVKGELLEILDKGE